MIRLSGCFAFLLLVACGDGSGGAENNNACPAGYSTEGPACVPIFDDYTGSTEIPVLGGGCRAVGVTHCATGLFEPDGADGCAPVLPAQTCPPGSLAVIGQTVCQPVGVVECADGFESDGSGGCNIYDAAQDSDCPLCQQCSGLGSCTPQS
ncbi:MAG: hypothetical protein GY778_25110, partial [bacterium]|nr:hypothetical protein [bacterium]